MPEYVPIYEPGRSITMRAGAPIVGGQLVRISGSSFVAPTSAASADWLGVAAHDAETYEPITVYRMGIQRFIVSPAGTITAGQNVEGAANGCVSAHTNGASNDASVTVGLALNTATPGALVEVSVRR